MGLSRNKSVVMGLANDVTGDDTSLESGVSGNGLVALGLDGGGDSAVSNGVGGTVVLLRVKSEDTLGGDIRGNVVLGGVIVFVVDGAGAIGSPPVGGDNLDSLDSGVGHGEKRRLVPYKNEGRARVRKLRGANSENW